MSAPNPRTPAERPHSPVEMSLAEKIACEWEARHDVAARRRVADVAPVQHYLTHARCEDGRRSPGAKRTPRERQRTDARSEDVARGLRAWLRWGEDGGPEHPIIPRC